MALKDLSFVQIPVTSVAAAYLMKVPLDGSVFQLLFYFNDRLGEWEMDVQDQNGNPLATSIPMLPDYPLNWSLAQRFPALPRGLFYLVDGTGQDRTPGRNAFGGDISLEYLQAGS